MRRALILVAVLAAALSAPVAVAAPRSVEVWVTAGHLFPTQAEVHWISDGQAESDPLPSHYRRIVRADAGTCVRISPVNEDRGERNCVGAGPIRYSCQGELRCTIVMSGDDKVAIDVSVAPRHSHRGSS
jgi:hypothetical protein